MARKYIKFNDGSFVIFDHTLRHVDMATTPDPDLVPVSAGSVGCMEDGRLHCVGASTGLNLAAMPTDTEELRAWLSIG